MGKKMVKISVLIIFQGIDFEIVRNDQMKKNYKTHVPKGMYAPRLSHIYVEKFRFKWHLLWNYWAFWAPISYLAFRGRGEKVYVFYANPKIKMAAMPIYGKNPSKIFFSRTAKGIWTKFGMKHVGSMMIIFCDLCQVWITNVSAAVYWLSQKWWKKKKKKKKKWWKFRF